MKEWMTSAPVTCIRMTVPIGSTASLSTVSSSSWPGFSLAFWTIRLVMSRWPWSGYRYSQYHWCPITFTVIWLFGITLYAYTSRVEGKARKTMMRVGMTVQTISSGVLWVLAEGTGLRERRNRQTE